ncbi:unnamed protein product [Vitrella brassicaformis CCMP3155]|uniref:EGF-like domain-containing protein n=2 Tax=Vitrella brassicaformis TaxID=1169539 RepID=A0A0G4GHV2_VITBC|nr:unnamed protein product [Vitrella brassicaformis CCMP3155]|eukprot:CEM29298.1 unnamed protein product [Vitrella brassicaformis CCMP3155]
MMSVFPHPIMILPPVVLVALCSSLVASSPLRRTLQAANQTAASPPLPPGRRDPTRLKLLQRSRVFRPADEVDAETDEMLYGDNILPYTEMEELERCDSCQEDAAALFDWSYEAGLVDNETESIFEDNLCVVSFITCVRLSEALADGGPRKGYIIDLSGDADDMEISDVPLIVQQRGWKPFVFSDVFYRLRHIICFSAYQLPMQGSLGDEIAKVTSLRAIFLSIVDGMNGPLPTTIGELPYLKGLYILLSSFSGPIPSSLTNLSRLEALVLARTDLSGPIPQDIGRLHRLRILEIWSNKRMEGPFPASVTSCRNLRRMALDETGLVGSLPVDLGTLSRLDDLRLANNSLSGELPRSLVQLRRLRVLNLSNNRFSGPLPEGLESKMNSLQYLEGLSGPLPIELGGCKSMEVLDLYNNNFSGSLEPLSNLTSLIDLFVSNNSFEGYLPLGSHSFPNLTTIEAANNRLTAMLDRPSGGPAYPNVRYLDLASNRLNTSIDLTLFPNLVEASFRNNRIPGFIGNGSMPKSLWYLSLADNLLTALPEGFRSMPNLLSLNLANNRISQWPTWGSTPPGLCKWDSLSLDIVKDDPPPDWGSLTVLDVSNNPINTDVTAFLMPLKWQRSLMELDASNCSLYGPVNCEAFTAFEVFMDQGISVTPSIWSFQMRRSFPSLVFLSLRDNRITAIDTGGVQLALDHVDFSNNSLVDVASGDWSFFDVLHARFTENPDLRYDSVDPIPIEKCQDSRHNFSEMIPRPLVPDPQGYVVRTLDNGEERFECTEFCSTFNKIEVDYTINSDALCRCLPGYEGTGANCTICPRNTYSKRDDGTRTCEQCPDDAGSDEGSAACYCRLGYEKRGDEPCEPCTEGSVGERKGGTDGSRRTWICRDCLPGVNCSVPVNYKASVVPGFFQLTVELQSDASSHATREVTTYGEGLTRLPIVMQCPVKSACQGTNETTGLNICSEGHEGFVCNRCKATFSRQTPRWPCKPCAALWQIIVVNVLFVVTTLMAIFILTALAERAASSPRAEVPSQLIKIGLYHITAVGGLAFVVFDESLENDRISSLIGSFFAWDGGVLQSYQVWECVLRRHVGERCVLYRHALWLGLPLVWLTVVPLIASAFDKVRGAFKSRRRRSSDRSTDTYLRAPQRPQPSEMARQSSLTHMALTSGRSASNALGSSH